MRANKSSKRTLTIALSLFGSVLCMSGFTVLKSESRAEELWVPKDQFYRLYPLPNGRETPIQRRVKLAKLRRCDVTALVMYTGECSCGVRELTCTSACIL